MGDDGQRAPLPEPWRRRLYLPAYRIVWLAEVGQRGWIAMGQDYRHHLVAVERDAIRAHRVGVFYLWGANASQWEQLRVLAKAWDRIEAACREPAPFIYRIRKDGRLEAVAV